MSVAASAAYASPARAVDRARHRRVRGDQPERARFGAQDGDIGEAVPAAIAWLHPSEARDLCGLDADAEVPLDHPVLRAHLEATLAEMASGSGSAGRVARLVLSAEPPDLDAGEITDKGYINQRVVLERRAEMVERLYAPEPDREILRCLRVAMER